MYAIAFFINAACVWLLWLHNAPDDVVPLPSSTVSSTGKSSQSKAVRYEPKLDFEAISPIGVPVKSSQAATAKLSNSGTQQPFTSRFAGIVDGMSSLCWVIAYFVVQVLIGCCGDVQALEYLPVHPSRCVLLLRLRLLLDVGLRLMQLASMFVKVQYFLLPLLSLHHLYIVSGKD